jgi:hypothetical protein
LKRMLPARKTVPDTCASLVPLSQARHLLIPCTICCFVRRICWRTRS